MGDTDQHRLHASIRRFPMFEGLTGAQLDFVAEGVRVLCAGRGDLVCHSHKDAGGFYGLLDGRLKLALLSRGGREHVFDILQPGMSFGDYTVRLQAPCPLYVEALTKSEVLYLSREQMLAAIRHWPQLGLSLVDTLTGHLHRVLSNLATCCQQSAAQRVAHYLLAHAGARCSGRGATVTLPVGKAVVACSLDLTPETFSRELHQLEKDGLLMVSRRTIHIFDLDKLYETAF
jgi:CRP-like cAMP-binding protein